MDALLLVRLLERRSLPKCGLKVFNKIIYLAVV